MIESQPLSGRPHQGQAPSFLGGLALAGALALAPSHAADQAMIPVTYSGGAPPPLTVAAYQALSANQSRNYDRTQDISLRQMRILLDVSERTGASLGQALATGEMESAYTWNDHVRPTLKNGSLGSATGVWQFLPGTFHGIVKKYGAQLLAASEANAAMGRERLDLSEGPFTDAKVRSLILETMDGQRGADDEELQLLRHNFAVLAFAKHYLSVENGATTAEEDYLFHFLGAGQGRRVLALARGEARDTLCVKAVEAPAPTLETSPELATVDGRIVTIPALAAPSAAPPMAVVPAFVARAGRAPAPPPAAAVTAMASRRALASPTVAAAPATTSRVSIVLPPPVATPRGQQTAPGRTTSDRIITILRGAVGLEPAPLAAPETGLVLPMAPLAPPPPPPVSSQWGLPANSPTVTGNLGMFYRDGKGQSQPYTWAGFLANLAKRVRAADQPALVRAKYGVGFALKGGDVAERSFNPANLPDPVEFRYENGRAVLVPEVMVIGPLGRDEIRQYKERVTTLISQGEDAPRDTLSPEALAALRHLKLLPPQAQEPSTTHPEVRKALHQFRKKIGKEEPKDPAHANLLTPAERIALEFYDQRITRYAQLQAGQLASFNGALDLNRIKKLPARQQRLATPHIAALQTALAAQGLLTQPTQKVVWRDRKRKKHVEYNPRPFPGKLDKATVVALNTFQLRNGLRKTLGIVDAVTLNMLGLPTMGPDIFLPITGPQCPFYGWTETDSMCEVAEEKPTVCGPRCMIRPG
ncbi:peptidoglycan-binding domain-containing protein [uncultured Thiodictyon sp.]|uniref:peptidoglycan-binding domain-containing protein n=1 Tax=uncultured Thiodictyon sp. TaxID=1846217 RepID=UPI0025CF3DEA|nr:peptidoglycan-binding domain-containing protein [uncultured Thiodictyon sp.]